MASRPKSPMEKPPTPGRRERNYLTGFNTNRFWVEGHKPKSGPGAKFNKVVADNVAQIVTCYVCGRGYSYASIKSHLRVCPDKRHTLLRRLPASVRRPLPEPPALPVPRGDSSAEEVAAYNDVAAELYKDGMPKCPNDGCGRRFAPERVMVHVIACELPSPRAKKSAPRPDLRRMLVCYCCGMTFSYASLPLHVDDCPAIRKNEYRVALPVNLRPRIPQPPAMAIPLASSTQEEYDAYNEEAKRIFATNMPTCPNVGCHRSCEPDRLTVHLKSCSFPRPGYRPGAGRERPLNIYTCYICGKQYGPTSIKLHWRQCLPKRASIMRTLPLELRPPAPRPPRMKMPGDGVAQDVVDSYNREAQSIYEEFLPCCPKKGCGRGFAPGRLMIHVRNCDFPDASPGKAWKHPGFASDNYNRPQTAPELGKMYTTKEVMQRFGAEAWLYDREGEERARVAAATQKLKNGSPMKEARLRLFGSDVAPPRGWTSKKASRRQPPLRATTQW